MLLDTCVISEVSRKRGSKRVRDRVASLHSTETFLSVITIGEITNGIERLPASRKKTDLSSFLSHLEHSFGSRILSVDPETARIWGEISASADRRGQRLPATDGLIAATAVQHGLHVMTRNVSDFEGSGALLFDPWDAP